MIQTPIGASKVYFLGEITIRQRDAFALGSLKRIINYNTDDLYTQLSQKTVLEYIDQINSRNITSKIKVLNSYTTPSIGASVSPNNFQLSLDIRIPAL